MVTLKEFSEKPGLDQWKLYRDRCEIVVGCKFMIALLFVVIGFIFLYFNWENITSYTSKTRKIAEANTKKIECLEQGHSWDFRTYSLIEDPDGVSRKGNFLFDCEHCGKGAAVQVDTMTQAQFKAWQGQTGVGPMSQYMESRRQEP